MRAERRAKGLKKERRVSSSLKFQESEVSRDGSFVLSKVIKVHKAVSGVMPARDCGMGSGEGKRWLVSAAGAHRAHLSVS